MMIMMMRSYMHVLMYRQFFAMRTESWQLLNQCKSIHKHHKIIQCIGVDKKSKTWGKF